jgi:alkyl hydroperoxide reductase subunit AhpC
MIIELTTLIELTRRKFVSQSTLFAFMCPSQFKKKAKSNEEFKNKNALKLFQYKYF